MAIYIKPTLRIRFSLISKVQTTYAQLDFLSSLLQCSLFILGHSCSVTNLLLFINSQIALFGMHHVVHGINFLMNFASLSRYSLFCFYLISHIAVHQLHYHHSSFVTFHFFVLSLTPGCLTNISRQTVPHLSD